LTSLDVKHYREVRIGDHQGRGRSRVPPSAAVVLDVPSIAPVLATGTGSPATSGRKRHARQRATSDRAISLSLRRDAG